MPAMAMTTFCAMFDPVIDCINCEQNSFVFKSSQLLLTNDGMTKVTAGQIRSVHTSVRNDCWGQDSNGMIRARLRFVLNKKERNSLA